MQPDPEGLWEIALPHDYPKIAAAGPLMGLLAVASLLCALIAWVVLHSSEPRAARQPADCGMLLVDQGSRGDCGNMVRST